MFCVWRVWPKRDKLYRKKDHIIIVAMICMRLDPKKQVWEFVNESYNHSTLCS